MEKEFVTYEQALALKELGFDEPCICRYCIVTEWEKPTGGILLQQIDCKISDKTFIKAPLYQQSFRWFREKHNLFGKVYITNFGGDEYSFNIYDLYEEEYKYENFIGASMSYAGTFEAYEEAELACLEKLIEIVESKSE